jgi:hypothetical protein
VNGNELLGVADLSFNRSDPQWRYQRYVLRQYPQLTRHTFDHNHIHIILVNFALRSYDFQSQGTHIDSSKLAAD